MTTTDRAKAVPLSSRLFYVCLVVFLTRWCMIGGMCVSVCVWVFFAWEMGVFLCYVSCISFYWPICNVSRSIPRWLGDSYLVLGHLAQIIRWCTSANYYRFWKQKTENSRYFWLIHTYICQYIIWSYIELKSMGTLLKNIRNQFSHIFLYFLIWRHICENIQCLSLDHFLSVSYVTHASLHLKNVKYKFLWLMCISQKGGQKRS